jgi:hypothetical protein
MHPETLRKTVRQAEGDSGVRPGLLSSQEREEIRRLRKENYELRRANEILKSGVSASLRVSVLDPQHAPAGEQVQTLRAGQLRGGRQRAVGVQRRPHRDDLIVLLERDPLAIG